MSDEPTTAAHPAFCIGPDGQPVEHEPHFVLDSCDCLCSACCSADGLLCICPDCKGDECPDNIWQANRHKGGLTCD